MKSTSAANEPVHRAMSTSCQLLEYKRAVRNVNFVSQSVKVKENRISVTQSGCTCNCKGDYHVFGNNQSKYIKADAYNTDFRNIEPLEYRARCTARRAYTVMPSR